MEVKKKKLMTGVAMVAALGGPARSQNYTATPNGVGGYNITPDIVVPIRPMPPGPTGFGAGFAQGLSSSLARRAAPFGSYLPGVIVGARRQLQFEIQVSLAGGGARAFDPVKQEHFSGTYAATGIPLGLVSATAMLVGDRGSYLSCEMHIRAGSMPTGNGDCVDRKNSHYRLQF
jgi:hypothetical protein